MNIKDATQTRNGRLVRIYATDGGGIYPVHGAIYILTDWRDEIPWECLRDEIQYARRPDKLA